MVTPAYFETFGISMRRGRAFTERDRAGSVPVAIVNEAFVKRFLPGVDPLGQRLLMQPFRAGPGPEPDAVEWQIVGVYGEVANATPGREPYPQIDVPFWQIPWPRATMAVRTVADAGGAQAGIAEILGRLDPELPMADVKTMEQVVSQSLAADRFYTVFFGAFAAVALLLAAVGIYGVMSFVVAQRTHEIGLRMALGAGRGQVLAQILREGMATALAGTVVGGVGAWFVGPRDEGNGVRRGRDRPRAVHRGRPGAAGCGDGGVPGARAPRGVGGPDGRAASGVSRRGGTKVPPYVEPARGERNTPAALISITSSVTVPMITAHARCGCRCHVVSRTEKASV